LTQDFNGFLWDENIASERDEPESNGGPVSYPAGTVGTVMLHPQGEEEYMVQLDYQKMTLAARFSKLERIRGYTRVIPDGDGGVRIQQLFGYLDAVRLRQDLTCEGRTYKAGSIGRIHSLNRRLPPVQVMEESWRTGVYDMFLNDHGERSYFSVHGSALQLASDFT
jgi:hypothetical protein